MRFTGKLIIASLLALALPSASRGQTTFPTANGSSVPGAVMMCLDSATGLAAPVLVSGSTCPSGGGGGGGGDASAANQTLQITQATSTNTILGAVTASPTANTIGDRLKTINTTLGSPFQSGGSIGNTTFAATQGTAANLNATVVGTGTFVVQNTNAAETTKVLGTVRNLGNAGAIFDAATSAAVPANALQVGMAQGGNLIALTGTSGNLNVQCANCSGSGVSTADEATFTAGTSLFAGGGGFFQTTATSNALTNGQQGMFQLTATRAIFSNLRNAAGTEVGTSTTPLQVSVANTGANGTAMLVTGTGGTFPVTATNLSTNVAQINGVTTLMGQGATGTGSIRVTLANDNTLPTGWASAANQTSIIGTKAPGTAATNALLAGAVYTSAGVTLTDGQQAALQFTSTGDLKVSGTGVAQGSTTSGQTGSLVMGAVTTTSPTYTTAQSSPLSLDTAGSLRVAIISGAGSGGTAIADGATFTEATTSFTPIGGEYVSGGGANCTTAKGCTLQMTIDRMAYVNVGKINGVVPLMGNGVTGTGSQRVTIASDNTAFSVNSTLSAETTKVIGTVNVAAAQTIAVTNAGTFATQSTLAAETTKVIGTVRNVGNAGAIFDFAGQNATVPANALLAGCGFNTTPTTITSGNASPIQCDNGGKVLVNPGTVTVTATNLSTNLAQIAGTTASVNSGNKDNGTLRTAVATDQLALATWGHVATGAAPPTGATYIGANTSGATGGLVQGLIQCDSSAPYDASTNGSTELVALTASRTIYVCGYSILNGGTATNVKLIYGTGTACATGSTNMTPAYQLIANAGIVDGSQFSRGLKTASANALCINTSAGNAVQAIVYYAKL